jgi:peptide/nickel transport system permease protein
MQHSSLKGWAWFAAAKLRDLAILLFALSTLLFFLLRAAGDPAQVMAGPEATAEALAAIRAEYGFDQPLLVQYGRYLFNLVTFDFGLSLASREPALSVVLKAAGPTILLTFAAMAATLLVAIPLGAWLGQRPDAPGRRAVAGVLFVLQGVPGFVITLLLIQVFAVWLLLLPSTGFSGPQSWILPVAGLASFLAPKLARVLAANVAESMREDYVRTARAIGASEREVLWRHAVPNALLGAAALIGAQFAFLLGGSVVTEAIFSWPGLGWHLLKSTQTLDFPVVQAIAVAIAVLVFAVTTLTDLSFRLLDPRLRTQGA